MAAELKTRGFFKRFEVEELVQYLPLMVAKSHRKGSFLFPDEQICIVLGGIVEAKQHHAKRRVPVPYAKFQAGDILGFDHGDRG